MMFDAAAYRYVEDRSTPVPEAGCWLWEQSIDRQGYAVGMRDVAGKRLCRAHRIAYAAINGLCPTGLELDHVCNVRSCVNPRHLRAVTHAENAGRQRRQGSQHRNARKTHCKRGHPLAGHNVVAEVWRGRVARKCRECRNLRQRVGYRHSEGLA